MDRAAGNASEWYGVKLLHRITISGIPEQDKTDEFFCEERTFFEESVLLIKASSFDAAYQIAERTAEKDNEVYKNKYGQLVRHEFYESIDCFHLCDSPKSTAEIYSAFFLKGQDEEEQLVLDKRYRDCTAEELHMLRHI